LEEQELGIAAVELVKLEHTADTVDIVVDTVVVRQFGLSHTVDFVVEMLDKYFVDIELDLAELVDELVGSLGLEEVFVQPAEYIEQIDLVHIG